MRTLGLFSCLLVCFQYAIAQTPNQALELPSLDDMGIDLDGELFAEEAPRTKWYDAIIPTLAYQSGLSLYEPGELTSHRFDIRLRGEHLTQRAYFFRMDGKLITRLPGDDQLASNESLDWDGRLREVFVQKGVDNWTLTFGFQNFAWGEMDAAQIADVITPRDYSEFAFTTPEDARLGQLLLNYQIYFASSQWQFLYSPWPQTNRYPGGSASSLLEFVSSEPIQFDNHQPAFLDDYELAMQWKSSQTGRDISIMLASLLANDPLFEELPTNNNEKHYRTKYSRFNMLAATINQSDANFLWKGEMAFKQNLGLGGLSPEFHDALETAIGFDFDANGAWSATVELFNQHIFLGTDDLPGFEQNNTQLLARWSKQWLNQTLTSIYFFSYQLQNRDNVHSFSLNYALSDNWLMDLNATLFDSPEPDSPGQLTKNWDQLTFRISFTY